MKKNNKGFTLIELLAVIVILAIIAVIATPIIINVVKDSKKSTFETTVHNIVKASDLYYAKSNLDETIKGNLNGSTNVIDLIEMNGEKPRGIVYINEQGSVTVALHNNDWCATKEYEEEKIEVKKYVKGDCLIPGVFKVSGKVLNYIKDNSSDEPIVSLYKDKILVKEIMTVDGVFELTGIESGKYTLQTINDKYTDYIDYSFILDSNKTGININIYSGDINNDDAINNLDRELVNKCLNKNIIDNIECKPSDLNNDGLIDYRDRNSVNSNYNKITQIKYDQKIEISGTFRYDGKTIPTLVLKIDGKEYLPEINENNFTFKNIPSESMVITFKQQKKSYEASKHEIYLFDNKSQVINLELYAGNVIDTYEICDESDQCITHNESVDIIDNKDIEEIKAKIGAEVSIGVAKYDLNDDNVINQLDVDLATKNLEKLARKYEYYSYK